MINLLGKISHIINKKQSLLLALSFLLVIFTTLLETIGLGSIAGFVYFISDPELILEKYRVILIFKDKFREQNSV